METYNSDFQSSSSTAKPIVYRFKWNTEYN